MKKIVSLAVLATLTTTGAIAAPSYIKRDARGGYDVTYDDEGICFIASKNDGEDVRRTKFFPIIQELVRLQSDVITVEHSFEDDEDYKNCFVIY